MLDVLFYVYYVGKFWEIMGVENPDGIVTFSLFAMGFAWVYAVGKSLFYLANCLAKKYDVCENNGDTINIVLLVLVISSFTLGWIIGIWAILTDVAKFIDTVNYYSKEPEWKYDEDGDKYYYDERLGVNVYFDEEENDLYYYDEDDDEFYYFADEDKDNVKGYEYI